MARICEKLRLYHGTPQKNLACIIRDGLKSKCEAPEAVTFFKGWAQERDLIWFTDDFDMAKHHALGYDENGGVIITADVEICNPLDWDEPIGSSKALKIRRNAERLPCDEYVKRTYAKGVSASDDGSDAIVRIAERCMKESKGMGEIMKLLGFGSFRQSLSERQWMGRGATNWAVTDGTPIDIVETDVVE